MLANIIMVILGMSMSCIYSNPITKKTNQACQEILAQVTDTLDTHKEQHGDMLDRLQMAIEQLQNLLVEQEQQNCADEQTIHMLEEQVIFLKAKLSETQDRLYKQEQANKLLQTYLIDLEQLMQKIIALHAAAKHERDRSFDLFLAFKSQLQK